MNGGLPVTKGRRLRRAAEAGGQTAMAAVRAVYGIVMCLVAAASIANAFSGARDIPWRLGTPHNLWEPMLWNLTSGVVVMALLPIIRRAVLLLRSGGMHPGARRGRLH